MQWPYQWRDCPLVKIDIARRIFFQEIAKIVSNFQILRAFDIQDITNSPNCLKQKIFARFARILHVKDDVSGFLSSPDPDPTEPDLYMYRTMLFVFLPL